MNARVVKTRGHTLLELTIALALGVLIVLAALMLYRAQRASFERAADAARIHDAAAVALDIIGQQIQMAGFGASAVDAPLFGCAQGRVTGPDASATCESLSSRSDGVQIRYAADVISTWPTSAGVPTDCLGQAVTDSVVTNRMYAKLSASTGEPELYCEGSGKQSQPLTEGIEKMRVLYWLKGASGGVDASAITRERWPDVVAAEICVLVRGYLQQAKRRANYIDCNGAPAFTDDGRARQAFWRRVAIRNARGAA
jgi:type IV pilus assembly protein PilW